MKKLTFFFLIVLFFSHKIDLVASVKISEKNFINPYCQGNITFNSIETFTPEKIPKKIDIEITNSRRWYANFFKAVKSLGEPKLRSGAKIDPRVKKFHRAILTVYYANDLKCVLHANIRIHGSRGIHISPSDFISSMRVKLIDGNILHRSQFILFLPESRNNDNEIFITTLLKELNLLAPLTFSTMVTVNDGNPTKLLFQEKAASALLKANKRRDGIILAANKNSQIVEAINIKTGGTINLGRVINSRAVENKDKIKALDKLNYLYLQTLGYGNGSKFTGNLLDHKEVHYFKIKEDYFYEDYTGFEKISVFDSIMIATGGAHGLTPEDRRFYYDTINDRLEPIYYDGKIEILNKDFELKIYGVYDHHKFGAEKAKNYIAKLNTSKFQKSLNLRGLDFDIKEINSLFQRIINNLDIILDTELVDFESPYVKNYYSKHENKNQIKFKLAFGGNNNIFQLCDVFLEDCATKKFNSLETIDIFKEQVAKINGKHIFYVRKTIDSYINNLPPNNNGLAAMRKLDLNSESEIFINNKIVVDINNNTKIVKLHMLDHSGRAIVRGKKLNEWVFFLQGDSQNFMGGEPSKSHGVDPQGCITFIDSEIKGISIYAKNTACPNTIHFIRTSGTIDTIKIQNATYDAFDADFSNLEIKNIEVNNAGNECIGLKGGKYKIINAYLEKCMDKAVSSGEISQTIIEKIEITNSFFGLAAKDSGIIVAKNVKINKTDVCLIAYRNKIEYQGGYINTSKSNYFCENNYYFIQKGSKWVSLN